jgi:ERI1 exoribonuclease 3
MDYLYVLDFEATCTDTNEFPDHEMEIIEFPIIIFDLKTNKVIDIFHTYVKPVINPTLTNFCKELTKIKQQQVDNAIEFKDALTQAAEFIAKYPNGHFVTCGDWDLKTALPNQIKLAQINIKSITNYKYFKAWINIHKEFKNFYEDYNRGKKSACGSAIKRMLQHLNMEFEGTLHSGIDDTKNIVRIVKKMAEDGYDLYDCHINYL